MAGEEMRDHRRRHRGSWAGAAAAWCLAALWAAFIFFMSAHTGADLDGGSGFAAQVKRWLTALAAPVFGEGTDVVSTGAHFLEYAVFGALLFGALFLTRRCRREGRLYRLWSLALVAVAIASLYGATDEFHQLFVPGRLCDPADWLTDTCGAALGAALAAHFMSNRPR